MFTVLSDEAERASQNASLEGTIALKLLCDDDLVSNLKVGVIVALHNNTSRRYK